MSTVPTAPVFLSSYGTRTDRSPSVRYSPSIRNSGRDSASSRVSSVPTTNEPNRCKSSCGARSPVQTLNEDPQMSTIQVPLHPCVSGPSNLDKVYSKPTSYVGSDPPPKRLDGDFGPSRSLPTSLPVRPVQADTPAGDATLISFFCHACGLFIQGERDEALEILVRHRCIRPIDGGYADPPEYFPPDRSHSRCGPLNAEVYPQPNPTPAGSSLSKKTCHTTAPRGQASAYYDGHPQTPLLFASFKQLLDASRSSFQDTYLEHHQRFEPQSDIVVRSDTNVAADTVLDMNHYSYHNANTYFDNKPPTLDWPGEKVDGTNVVINPQPVNATYATMSSAHPSQQCDEWQVPVSQNGIPFGPTRVLAPHGFVSRRSQDPYDLTIDTTGTDWPRTRGSDSAYTSKPKRNPSVCRGYPLHAARFDPYDSSSRSSRV